MQENNNNFGLLSRSIDKFLILSSVNTFAGVWMKIDIDTYKTKLELQ